MPGLGLSRQRYGPYSGEASCQPRGETYKTWHSQLISYLSTIWSEQRSNKKGFARGTLVGNFLVYFPFYLQFPSITSSKG